MMLSESQERMLMVLRPEKEHEAEAIFKKWGLDFAIVGKTTDTLRFIVKHQGEVVADLPIKELGDEAPNMIVPGSSRKSAPFCRRPKSRNRRTMPKLSRPWSATPTARPAAGSMNNTTR